MTIDPGKPAHTPSEANERRAIWVEPKIEVLGIEQTETKSGVGHDGSFSQAPDCTKS
jgi:hypothetical protein